MVPLLLFSLTGKYLYEKYHLKSYVYKKKNLLFVFIINMKFLGIQHN